MQRTKSIFFKYFIICSAVILISFICLGAVLLLVSSQYFIGEKKDLLYSNVNRASVETQTIIRTQHISEGTQDKEYIWRDEVANVLKAYAAASNAEFFIVNDRGEIVASSDISLANFTNGRVIEASILEKISDEPVYMQSGLGGFFESTHHNVAVRFYDLDDNALYLFASASVSQQDSSVGAMMKLFLLSAVIVLLVSMIIVYFATIKLTAPIREMAEAAIKIGQGNFLTRLPEYEITEFDELGNAINDMSANLASYDKMRTSFVQNVSHELRTPMTSIGGFVDGMLDGTIPPSQHRKYLGLISTEIKRLTRLIRSMLNLAKIESGTMKPDMKMISIIEPIANTLFTFESRIEQKHIDIQGLDVGRVKVYADSDLIHQVMYNLIENAIKFVNDGGYIRFGFETEGDFVKISIENSGEGLSEDELPMIFDRFYKTDSSRSKDATGVGLGLNIVRSIVKLHGGNIRVTSVKGKYTRFIIDLKSKP